MNEHVTLLRSGARSADVGHISSALPRDLVEQARGRVRLLVGIVFVAFALDAVIVLGGWAAAAFSDDQPASDFEVTVVFQAFNLAAMAASAALWWAARTSHASATRLHTLAMAYVIAICFTIASTSFWQSYLDNGMLPNLTWVPAVVILFPLIMPGPPRRTLLAALAAAAMSPLALLLLDVSGKVATYPDAYLQATVSPAFAVGFAYMGARVVYGLGREVAAARELGSYRLEELLGRGGMGEVWRARHRMLARPAAVKVIRASLAGQAYPAGSEANWGVSEDALRRFEREAQAISRLRSPHTVDLFDYGVADDGSFYYAMELLDGLDADTLVRRFGPVPAERVIHVLRQVCHSLSEAQACGLVHRDIKPANIFLCRYGEDCDFVKVLDFGLVKTLDVADASPGLTRENVAHGTPEFIAPEQALGMADLDSRVDIYATGCVAYWLLTGRLVFSADTAMGLLLNHVHTLATPPSAWAELPIPAALDSLVLSCLAKDPRDRPQSARELSRRLAEIEVGRAWTEERARDWWARHQPGQV